MFSMLISTKLLISSILFIRVQVSTLIQKNMEETADVVSTQDWMLEDMRVLLAKVVNFLFDMDYPK